jgi:serine/threonine protein kinase/predicted negative regulator of RcsB-dependent stress response
VTHRPANRRILSAVSTSGDDPTLPGLAEGGLVLRADAPGARLARAAVLGAMFGAESETRVGRYIPRRRLGVGASGAVFLARDTALQRDVALKILTPHAYAPMDASSSRRYLREARAIARLAHPNVVEIFDVGVDEGRPYLAMELVDGGSLEDWLAEADRRPDEILDAFVQAARGLAAAHAVGIVHRDFKPANVLIGRDGRVRVADFGLANFFASNTEADGTPGARDTDDGGGGPLDLTKTGAIVGTPAYMAPEQHRGEKADALADQYGFCASLYFALHGQRPFEADSLPGLYHAKVNLQFVARTTKTQDHPIDAVLRRGLSAAREDRFASMGALIDAIDAVRRPRPRRRTRWMMGAVVVGVGAVWTLQARSGVGDCADQTHEIDDSWNAARRHALKLHLESLDPSLAARADAHLGRYIEDWKNTRRLVCESTVDGDADAGDAVDARMRCLRLARARFETTYDLLVDLDPEDEGGALELLSGLAPGSCELGDGTQLGPPRPADPKQAAATDRIRERVAALRPKLDTQRSGLSSPEFATLFDEAQRLDYAPLSAELYALRAKLHAASGDPASALGDYAQAYELAAAEGYDEIAFDAAVSSFRLSAVKLGKDTEADRWDGYAQSALARLGDPTFSRARYEDAAGVVALAREDFESAVAHGQLAVEAFAAAEPADPRAHASAMGNLGGSLRAAGRPRDAEPVTGEALQILEGQLGPDHRLAIVTRYTYAMLLVELGDVERAETLLDACLDSAHRTLPEGHPWLAAMENESGTLAAGRGDFAAAREHYARGLEAGRGVAGRQGAQYVAGIGGALAETLSVLGELDEAETILREALGAARTIYDEDHPQILLLRWRVGATLRQAGRTEEARTELTQCRTQAERTDQSDILALVEFDLAQLTYAEDPVAARALAHDARARWQAPAPISATRPLPDSNVSRTMQIDGWLAEHGA